MKSQVTKCWGPSPPLPYPQHDGSHTGCCCWWLVSFDHLWKWAFKMLVCWYEMLICFKYQRRKCENAGMFGRLWSSGVNVFGVNMWIWENFGIGKSQKELWEKKMIIISGHWHCCGRQTLVLHPQQTHWARWLLSTFTLAFICKSIEYCNWQKLKTFGFTRLLDWDQLGQKGLLRLL